MANGPRAMGANTTINANAATGEAGPLNAAGAEEVDEDVDVDEGDDEPRTALDDLDELLQDIAFEAANRLDWVAIVRQGYPALSEEQEQTLKDMGEAFAADQMVQREWDGPPPTEEDRRWVAEITSRLGPRYELDIPSVVSELLSTWTPASRGPQRPQRAGGRRR